MLKRYGAMIAVIALVLSLTACSGAGNNKEYEPDIPEQMEPQAPVIEVPDAEIPPEDDTLRELRTVIKDKNCVLGAAFLGYAGTEETPKTVLESSGLYADYTFLRDLPDSSYKDAGGSEVYLFVPMAGERITYYSASLAEDGSIAVSEEPQWQGGEGQILVLKCNVSEIFSDALIKVNGTEFSPYISLADGHLAVGEEIYDFSDYATDAAERLMEIEQIRYSLSIGMSLLETGDIEEIGGETCTLVALGTDSGDAFIREELFAVGARSVYFYDPIGDTWCPIVGTAAEN